MPKEKKGKVIKAWIVCAKNGNYSKEAQISIGFDSAWTFPVFANRVDAKRWMEKEEIIKRVSITIEES